MASEDKPPRRRITRRQFLTSAGVLTACGIGIAASITGRGWWEHIPDTPDEFPPPEPPNPWSIEARYYASLTNEGSLECATCHSQIEERLPVSYCHIPHTGTYVRCNLCPHRCILADGERGICRVRENRGGRLYSMVYGNPCAINIDPIEKKPFFHYLPTAAALSLATAGCNLRCLYCQNWTISQVPPEETKNEDYPPEDIARYAHMLNIPVIAYTYSEPIVFYEYVLACSQAAKEVGVRNVVVSAGYIETDPLKELCQFVDAIKIDLKGYDAEFYREVCGGELEPVLQTLKTIFDQGVHLEIVNLVVPTLNDDLEQLRSLTHWVTHELSPDVPLHFSRFQPQYKLMNLPPTPVETLEKAYDIALEEGVRFVYIGNVPGHRGNNTYCPNCGKPLITRTGFSVLEYHLNEGACEYCGENIPGIWWSGEPEGQPIEIPQGPPDT